MGISSNVWRKILLGLSDPVDVTGDLWFMWGGSATSWAVADGKFIRPYNGIFLGTIILQDSLEVKTVSPLSIGKKRQHNLGTQQLWFMWGGNPTSWALADGRLIRPHNGFFWELSSYRVA